MGKPGVGIYLPAFLNYSETFIYKLLTGMLEYIPVVFCQEQKNTEAFPFNKVYSGAAVRNKSELLNLIKSESISLLHAQFGISGTELLKIKQLTGLPLITHFRGQDGYQLPKNIFINIAYKKLFRQGDLFLTVSEHLKQQLIKLGCPAEKILVYYGGIDLNDFRFIPRSFQKKEQYQVFMCGRLVEKKGYALGIKALAQLIKDGYDLKIKIAGSGPQLKKLQKLSQELFISQEIQFLSNLPYAEVQIELTRADFLFAPYRTARNGDREGIPNIIKEAMAVGLPVVTTDHSGIPELIQDNISGFLAKENDINSLVEAVKRLLENYPQVLPVVQKARQIIEEKFDLSKQIPALEEIYKNVSAKINPK